MIGHSLEFSEATLSMEEGALQPWNQQLLRKEPCRSQLPSYRSRFVSRQQLNTASQSPPYHPSASFVIALPLSLPTTVSPYSLHHALRQSSTRCSCSAIAPSSSAPLHTPCPSAIPRICRQGRQGASDGRIYLRGNSKAMVQTNWRLRRAR